MQVGQLLRLARVGPPRRGRAPYRDRRVTVRVKVVDAALELEIADQGRGFDWRTALLQGLTPSEDPSGRGIALIVASGLFHLSYRDPGNVALVRVPWGR